MSERFTVRPTGLPGLKTVDRQRLGDRRGFLTRIYDAQALSACGFDQPIVQINHTLTAERGTVRGMHYQMPPFAEDKHVSCLSGEVFDVAVDLRPQSATYLNWHAEVLSAENGRSLFIPQGFAHGFQAMTSDCELLYLHTAVYEPSAERGLSPTDPRLNIAWPLPLSQMSDRDRGHPLLDSDFAGVAL